MMPRPKRLRMEWKGDAAQAPDGTRYALFSEQIRGEARFWYPARFSSVARIGVDGKPSHWTSVDTPVNGFAGRREQAVRWAEVDAYERSQR